MAKDYFQDILPPDDSNKRPVPPPRKAETPAPAPEMHEDHAAPDEIEVPIRTEPSGERSIRNISMPQRSRPRVPDIRDVPSDVPVTPRASSRKRWWLWGIAIVCIAVLGVLLAVAMRSTVVSVTPRTQALTIDPNIQYTAYPVASAASGTLAYSISTLDLEDSEVVASTGTVHAEDKATGTLTVYNNYQTSPLKLIKNTRFQSEGGLIFRTPADVVIPAKKGTTPGQVTVTVVADQPGEQYNVAPGKFTVPGLKSSADMYAKVYAQSSIAMAGGFVGDKPGVAPAELSAAVAQVRSRLEAKARESATQAGSDVIVLPDLIRISYEEAPQSAEAGGGVRIHEKAHVVTPVFPSELFVQTVGGIDASGTSISLVPGEDFGARLLSASTTPGTDPLTFTLSGQASLLWGVDAEALSQALSGKRQSEFQGIVTQFPGIQEAHARIEPFWKSVFPVDPKAIKVNVAEPKAQ